MTWIDEMKTHMTEQADDASMQHRIDTLESQLAALTERVDALTEAVSLHQDPSGPGQGKSSNAVLSRQLTEG